MPGPSLDYGNSGVGDFVNSDAPSMEELLGKDYSAAGKGLKAADTFNKSHAESPTLQKMFADKMRMDPYVLKGKAPKLSPQEEQDLTYEIFRSLLGDMGVGMK